MNKYRIIKKNSRKAIFDLDGNQISNWWKYIQIHGLISNESEYYIAINNKDKYAIFS